MIAGAVVPYRYFPGRAGEPGPAQTLIDLGAGGAPGWVAIANLQLLTFVVLAVVSVGRVILRGPDPWGRGLQLGTGSIGALWMAGLVGATWDPPASPAAGAYLWIAGGSLLLLSGSVLPGDRETDAPVSSSRRGPLLAFLAVAVGLFAAAEVVGAVSLRNYVAGASLWVAGTVVFLAAAISAVVGGSGSKTTSTSLRRTWVVATILCGTALVVAGHLVPVGMFPERFGVRADRLIFLELPQHWTGIAFDAVFPAALTVLALAVALGAPRSRTSSAVLVALSAGALAGFIEEMWDPAIHPAETVAAGGFMGLAGGALLLVGALLVRPREVPRRGVSRP
jgi:hypothetical protein